MAEFVSLIVVPIFVGMVLKLFSYWLNKKDDD